MKRTLESQKGLGLLGFGLKEGMAPRLQNKKWGSKAPWLYSRVSFS